MESKLQIPDKHKELLKVFYVNRIGELEIEIKNAKIEIASIKEFLHDLNANKDGQESIVIQPEIKKELFATSIDNTNGYNSKWPLIQKSIYIVNKHGSLTISQIADKIIEGFEPYLKDKRSDLTRNLSAVLSIDQKKYKRLKRKTNDKNEYSYYL